MTKNVNGTTGPNMRENSAPLPGNFSASLSSAAKKMAPRIGPYTPQTSQSHMRGKQGQ